MFEETGLTVELGPLLDVVSDVRTLSDGTELHTVRVLYRVSAWTGELRAETNGTTDDVRWVAPEELSTLPLAFYVKDVVERFVLPR
jgi:ADP-ribose pyrophosphatase YjhB (NUDIX family)